MHILVVYPCIHCPIDRGTCQRVFRDMVHVCDIVMAQSFLKDHLEIPLSVDRTRADLQVQEEQYARMPKKIKSSLLDREQVWKLRMFEHKVARRSSVQAGCGPDDESFIHSEVSLNAPLQGVANGGDLDDFSPKSSDIARDTAPTVIYCGAMDYMPNVDALRGYFGARGTQICRSRFGWPGRGRQLSSCYSRHFQPERNSHEQN